MTVDHRFSVELRRLRTAAGLSLRQLGQLAHRSKSHLHELETGVKTPTLDTARDLDRVLHGGGHLVDLATTPADHAAEADELWRRVAASDVSTDTLDHIEHAVDDLASAYPTTLPADLLPLVRRHLAAVGRLLGGRANLTQTRRLIIASGWLALLRATLHIDLRQRRAADAHLATAGRLADHTDHPEIRAWCLETRAWDMLTQGEYRRALDLSRQAQDAAPRGSSAHIQATAQESRAWARMGDLKATRETLDRVDRLVAPLPVPDRPEHHFRYDPTKAHAYSATILAWAGDPAAEQVARSVLTELDPHGDGGSRPRRAASARLDLSLALLAAGQPDEAGAVAMEAIASGRVVPSNWWRASEVVHRVEHAGVREAADLREVYEAHRPTRTADNTTA